MMMDRELMHQAYQETKAEAVAEGIVAYEDFDLHPLTEMAVLIRYKMLWSERAQVPFHLHLLYPRSFDPIYLN